jgi:hypothetical protein
LAKITRKSRQNPIKRGKNWPKNAATCVLPCIPGVSGVVGVLGVSGSFSASFSASASLMLVSTLDCAAISERDGYMGEFPQKSVGILRKFRENSEKIWRKF